MKAGSSCGWVPKSRASTGKRPVGDWKPRQADIERDQVVVANGNQHTARIPEWPGADGFTG